MLTPDQIASLVRTVDARAHALRTATRGTPAFEAARQRLLTSLRTAFGVLRAPAGGEGYYEQLVASRSAAAYTYETATGQSLTGGNLGTQLVAAYDVTDLRERIAATLAAYRNQPSDANLERLRGAVQNANYYLLRKGSAANWSEGETALSVEMQAAAAIIAETAGVTPDDVVKVDPGLNPATPPPPPAQGGQKNYMAAVGFAAFGAVLIYLAFKKRGK